jgi:hypothetical protein
MIKKISLNSIIVFFVLLNILFLVFWLSGRSENKGVSFSELKEINSSMGFNELSDYLKKLAEEKGGRYAFQVLKMVELGPNIDLHLLGHDIGDVLFKQEGIEAITACDNDFRNACSHSVVIGIFSEKGELALPQIAEACKRAPGGKGAYTMCFHGLGHGILSFEGYDMEKASQICQKTGTKEYGFNESAQCIGGMVMEIIGGGFHDKEVWSKQRQKYLFKENPLNLCSQNYIPDNAKNFCYDYLTPFLFEAVGADVGNPKDEDFIKAFKFCENISGNEVWKDACFGGFGKEFDGLVQSRDIRLDSFSSISDDKLRQIHKWCALTADKEGQKSCMVHALNSLYWGGENDRKISINFCNQSLTNELQSICFSNLTNNVSYYISDNNYRTSYCQEIPKDYSLDCKQKLSN